MEKFSLRVLAFLIACFACLNGCSPDRSPRGQQGCDDKEYVRQWRATFALFETYLSTA
jgi:hypothetical protein